jgi:hypothetical protein
MTRSFFPHASHLPRGIFALASLTLVFGVFFHSQLLSKVEARQLVKLASAGTPATAKAAPAGSASEIFLELAATVGQTAPAKRLIDYKLKSDPSSQPRYWAVVDFNQPSTNKRLYVFDTVEKKVDSYYVAHGRGSEGSRDDGVPEVFSNQSGSNSSSLGIYRALDEYVGGHGRSLRLEGLEPTNSNALARAVVMHTADYVSEAFVRQTGRLGRSQGCFAVERSVGDTLINELKNGAYIIAAKTS